MNIIKGKNKTKNVLLNSKGKDVLPAENMIKIETLATEDIVSDFDKQITEKVEENNSKVEESIIDGKVGTILQEREALVLKAVEVFEKIRKKAKDATEKTKPVSRYVKTDGTKMEEVYEKSSLERRNKLIVETNRLNQITKEALQGGKKYQYDALEKSVKTAEKLLNS